MSEDRFLEGKRVLFLAFEYFDYHIHIRETIEEAGAEVDSFPVWKYRTTGEKVVFTSLRLLSTTLFLAYNKAYSQSLLKAIKGRKYDYVLVIAGFELPNDFYVELRRRNPEAVLINYHWDSIKTTMFGNTYLDIVPFFDKVYSFDREDCEAHGNLHYLPLFFTREYEQLRKEDSDGTQDIDLLFIGSLCEYRRYSYVKEIEKFCLSQGINFVHYMLVSQRFYIKNLLQGHRLTNVQFGKLSRNEIIDYLRRSKVVVDLPHHFQSGLTMRVLETLGAGKKLITGNTSIVKEPFYDEEIISLIDVTKPVLDVDFIKQPAAGKWNSKIEECSISNWLRILFGKDPIVS